MRRHPDGPVAPPTVRSLLISHRLVPANCTKALTTSSSRITPAPRPEPHNVSAFFSLIPGSRKRFSRQGGGSRRHIQRGDEPGLIAKHSTRAGRPRPQLNSPQARHISTSVPSATQIPRGGWFQSFSITPRALPWRHTTAFNARPNPVQTSGIRPPRRRNRQTRVPVRGSRQATFPKDSRSRRTRSCRRQ